MPTLVRGDTETPDRALALARLRAREQIFALLSHEIRTPLNGVLGMAGLLATTPLDPTQRAYLSTLQESGEHLLSLVNDVLDLAKLDSGRIELEPVEIDIERLMQGVCELLSPRAHAAGVDIAWATPRLPRVRADDGRLRQILFNLAGNAVKLTRRGGVLLLAEIIVGPSTPASHVRLRFRVKDTGPGLAQDMQTKVFEEFVQTEAGVQAGGAGLGLAIVRRLTEAFDGQLGVESRVGEGAEFWFEAEFESIGPPLDGDGLGGVSVAVVSASSIVREAALRQIQASGGIGIAAATPGEIDVSACAAVLVDAGPADAGAPSVLAVAGSTRTPCVVLLTPEARGRIDDYRAAGFAGYLIKPLRRASLVARVLAVTTGRDGPEPSQPSPMGEDERAAPAQAAGVRVLLAEDNPVNALLARALLVREGCTVDRVSTGQEALGAMQAAPYDIVLMDMRMPDMDGLAAARALRDRGERTPIVALTANAFEDDRRACLDAGMNDFLTKPLDAGALRAALTRWTGRSKSVP